MMKRSFTFSLMITLGVLVFHIGKTQVPMEQEVKKNQNPILNSNPTVKIEQIVDQKIALKNQIKMTSPLKKATERMVICRSTTAVRTLRIEKNSGDHCQTFYTKAGVDQNIGKSQNVESCLEYLNKVRVTLEKAQWACKDVKLSTLSTMTESVN
jgi:hypothetical protein